MHPFLKDNNYFRSVIAESKPVFLGNLSHVALSLLSAQIAESIPLIVITTEEHLLSVGNDIAHFGIDAKVIPTAYDDATMTVESYDAFGEIQRTLYDTKTRIIISTLSALSQKVELPHIEKALIFSVNSRYDFDALPSLLKSYGFTQVPLVEDKAQFALRGGIVDIFPIDALTPYRLDFLDDTIEEITFFDTVSQRSKGATENITLLPSYSKNSDTLPLYKVLESFSYVLCDIEKIEDEFFTKKSQQKQSSEFFECIEKTKDHILSQTILLASKNSIQEIDSSQLDTGVQKTQKFKETTLSLFDNSLEITTGLHPFVPLKDVFDGDSDSQTIHSYIRSITSQLDIRHAICAVRNEKEEKDIRESFAANEYTQEITFIHHPLSEGITLTGSHSFLLSYKEMIRSQYIPRKKTRITYHTPESSFNSLEKGDFVTHLHSGIGQYKGIEKQKALDGSIEEFMVIVYAKGAKLFVPLSQSHLVTRFIGASHSAPALTTLGSNSWMKAKVKATTSIVGYAKDLLAIEAKRISKGGFLYPENSSEVTDFEHAFPYDETDDQKSAINDIYSDMCSEKAMDRLICGDVGYGKTEVAIRAAFKAVTDGNKQVAVLVPTTILALQHYENFVERCKGFAIIVDHISRFKTAKENKLTLEKVEKGLIDILIGTHRIISKDVIFKDLGLVIVDEEQRFGVRTKEVLKKLKDGVDYVAMSATPIPRTLYFSLAGAKAMSVIASPPFDRVAIRSVLCEKNTPLIKNAIMRELQRNGQVFYIHNRVETISGEALFLQKLIPHARIAIVHGQMHSNDIDDVFHAFKNHNVDILVATSIVENGIDVPTANTILIDRADGFGISDLYQLRGRVGRWNRSSYAYFMTKPNASIKEETKKRLHALATTSGHGGGMKLAMLDLEIRGAGDILGEKQSGHVASIGFHLYCKLLKKAISSLGKSSTNIFKETKIEYKGKASIPSSYVESENIRLDIYQELGDAETKKDVDDIHSMLIDRFGVMPEETKYLLSLSYIRVFAESSNVTSIIYKENQIAITFLSKNKEKTLLFPFPKTVSPRELVQSTFEKIRLSTNATINRSN